MDEAERKRIAALVELHKRCPEAWKSFFKSLYEHGMVPGWRAIREIRLKEEKGEG